ncbi:hypothetical protein KIN20_029507 [Parelaphostrongylus tenuis]|uniref:Uncharacterized protein n=1 Tax=Parelaphostrongylus tenuis TaxID=148309 RepID=A0AAD5R2N3_PARTN|nr:hypothetical protein KIN20_029507 [Parelaphostrongylus tenuis]
MTVAKVFCDCGLLLTLLEKLTSILAIAERFNANIFSSKKNTITGHGSRLTARRMRESTIEHAENDLPTEDGACSTQP